MTSVSEFKSLIILLSDFAEPSWKPFPSETEMICSLLTFHVAVQLFLVLFCPLSGLT